MKQGLHKNPTSTMEFLLIPPLIIVVILLSIYPIYKLYQHLKATKASNWAWFGFIILMLKFCSGNHTETVYKDSPQSANITTSPYFSATTTEPLGNIEFLSIQFDSTRVRDLTIILKNDGWFEEKNGLLLKTSDIKNFYHKGDDLVINIYKMNTSNFKTVSHSQVNKPIELEIKCNLIDGKCRITENDEEYEFDSNKVE